MLNLTGKKTYLSLGAILVLLIFFNFIGLLNPIKNFVRNIFIPIYTKSNELSIQLDDNFEFFKNKNDFFQSYQQCQDQLINQKVDQTEMEIIKEENYELRQILNFSEKTQLTPKIARVIGKNTDNTNQSIIIDRGYEEGIQIGQPVIIGSGILLGKIIKVEQDMAIVRLINDSQSKIAATVINNEKSLGIIEGGYGLSIKMNFIPRNETVLIGEKIITSGLEEYIPRGLLIGEVTAIENETYRPFQSAIINSSADLDKIFLVSVLINHQ